MRGGCGGRASEAGGEDLGDEVIRRSSKCGRVKTSKTAAVAKEERRKERKIR
jgi:hypothetical protein